MTDKQAVVLVGGTSLTGSALLSCDGGKFTKVKSKSFSYYHGEVGPRWSIVVVNRHTFTGEHKMPHEVDYGKLVNELNALKMDIVTVISVGSVGTMHPKRIPVGAWVCLDDIFSPFSLALDQQANSKLSPSIRERPDFTTHITPSFHPGVRQALTDLMRHTLGVSPVCGNTTYVQTVGPRFESKAEIRWMAQVGHVVGMTLGSESAAMQTAGFAHAAVCMVDNRCNGVTVPGTQCGACECGSKEKTELTLSFFKEQVKANQKSVDALLLQFTQARTFGRLLRATDKQNHTESKNGGGGGGGGDGVCGGGVCGGGGGCDGVDDVKEGRRSQCCGGGGGGGGAGCACSSLVTAPPRLWGADSFPSGQQRACCSDGGCQCGFRCGFKVPSEALDQLTGLWESFEEQPRLPRLRPRCARSHKQTLQKQRAVWAEETKSSLAQQDGRLVVAAIVDTGYLIAGDDGITDKGAEGKSGGACLCAAGGGNGGCGGGGGGEAKSTCCSSDQKQRCVSDSTDYCLPGEPDGMNDPLPVTRGVSVVVFDGRILDILPSDQAAKQYVAACSKHISSGPQQGCQACADAKFDLSRSLVIPGLVNCHTHMGMHMLKGFSDDLNLSDWLHTMIFPTEAKFADGEFVRDGTRLACAEMVASGTTCVNDMYFYPQSVCEAMDEVGMRGRVSIPMLDFPMRYANGFEDFYRKGIDFLEKSQYRQHPLICFSAGPHAPYTISDDSFVKVAAMSVRYELPIHCHVHETLEEVENSAELNRTGQGCHLSDYTLRPLWNLYRLGITSDRLIGAHMVHLNDKDLQLVRATRAACVNCPSSNLKLGSGPGVVKELTESNCIASVGTDGVASNNGIDMLQEVKLSAILAKGVSRDPRVVPAERMFRMMTIGGARAVHLDDLIGSLEIGKQADFVALRVNALSMAPAYSLVSHCVYVATGGDVTHTWIGGRCLYREGVHTTVDAKKLLENALDWGEKLADFRDELIAKNSEKKQ